VYDESGKKKQRTYFVFSRTSDGKVMLMPQWWTAILREAAQVVGKHNRHVGDIRFSLEVDGQPRPIPKQLYKRYYEADKFSCHEAFYPGDVIGVTCLVPDTITHDDLWALLDTAGTYFGISPARWEDRYGRFKIESIEKRGPQCVATELDPKQAIVQGQEFAKEETPSPTMQ
jgi:hypothetical protein